MTVSVRDPCDDSRDKRGDQGMQSKVPVSMYFWPPGQSMYLTTMTMTGDDDEDETTTKKNKRRGKGQDRHTPSGSEPGTDDSSF